MEKQQQRRFHYASVILVSIALQRFIACAENSTSGLFLIPVTTALGVNQGTYMLYQTIQYGLMGVVTFLMPKLTAKFNYMTLNKAGLISIGCGVLCMSRAQSVWAFYLAGVLNGLGLVVCNLLLMGTLIPRWFRSGMGVAMATSTLLFTLPSMLLSPTVSYLLGLPSVLGMESWRGTYLLLACLPLTLGLLNACFVLKGSPAEMGLQPYGEAPHSAESAVQAPEGIRKSVALHDASCIFLALTVALWSAIATIGPYLASYAATSAAASLVSFDLKGFIGVALSSGSLSGAYLIGFANDRWGAKGGVIIGCVCGSLGAASLLLGNANSLLILGGAVLMGIFMSMNNLEVPLMVGELYGHLDYDKLYPLFTAVGGALGALSTSFWGLLHDLTGSYSTMLTMAVLTCAAACVLGMLAIQKSKRLW